jgi:hypothetical protein
VTAVGRSPDRVRRWLALGVIATEVAAVAALAIGGAIAAHRADAGRGADRTLAAGLGLTGLALWSEAGYCRHPAQADLFAAHADHPGALEHFPGGSLVPPRPVPHGDAGIDAAAGAAPGSDPR